MARSQSTITIIGNVTDEPDLKFTPSGAAVTNFSVAVNERVKNQQTQEWEDAGASFYRVAAWRDLAENVAESITKGNRVIVVGPLKVRQYDRADGTRGTSVDITADFVGPDLTWATAKVTKANHSGNNGGQEAAAPADDNPWATAAAPAAAAQPADEPPF